MGRSEFHRLRSALRVLLAHMLKRDHQPERRGRIRANTVKAQRLAVATVLRENPSLKAKTAAALTDAYVMARLDASGETDLPPETFPEALPYDWPTITERPFLHDLPAAPRRP